jgi:phosphatidylglycerophosphatase A
MKKFLPKISDQDLAVIRSLRMRSPYVWLATWFGSGFMRPAPGTWGSLAAMPFGLLLLAFADTLALIIAIVLVTLIGLWASREFEKDSGVHDSKMIVIDEVAGQWLAMVPLSLYVSISAPLFPVYVVLSFVFFRFFDITKPWPASFFDKKIKSAIGVMGDDIMAGFYAALLLTGIIFYAGSG